MIGFVGVDVGTFLLRFFGWFLRAAKAAHRLPLFLFFLCSHCFLSQLAHKNRAPKKKHRKPANQENRAEWKKKERRKRSHTQWQTLFVLFCDHFLQFIWGRGWLVMQINRKINSIFYRLKLATSSISLSTTLFLACLLTAFLIDVNSTFDAYWQIYYAGITMFIIMIII